MFGMGTGVTLAVRPPGNSFGPRNCRRRSNSDIALQLKEVKQQPKFHNENNALGKFYGQAERPISTGQLHALLRFHLPPIKVVVFDWPSYPPAGGLGNLISRRASRLDAFSDYLFRTSLPSYATGVTARSQEVRPSRSSRTRDSSSQVSCAHTR